jgi:hypothetical protein
MCGRFSRGAPAATLAAQGDLASIPTWTSRDTIAIPHEVRVVLQPSPVSAKERV